MSEFFFLPSRGCVRGIIFALTALFYILLHMSVLILVRHGQSVWNLENRFTGWTDVDLSTKGVEEARLAGQKLIHYQFDAAFTSALIRARHTLEIILAESARSDIPVFADKALNERNYGDLQGLNKEETRKQYGDAQFNSWRRSYAEAPPHGESLKDTACRVLPYYKNEIEPLLRYDKTVLLVAHGNSLRALMMYLEKLSPAEIEETEIATGVPRIYTFDAQLSPGTPTDL